MAEINYFTLSDLDELHDFIAYTVKTSYRELYSAEAVNFFLEYLNKADIATENKGNHILVLKERNRIVATATLINRHIKRVFVHPDCQGKGYGGVLMKKLEQIAFKLGSSFVELHSSLFAKRFYDNMGYTTFKRGEIAVKNGQVLPYYRMAKYLGEERAYINININGYTFRSEAFADRGTEETNFTFYQQTNLLFAEYNNVQISRGEMFGTIEQDKSILFYEHYDARTGMRISGRSGLELSTEIAYLSLEDNIQFALRSEKN